MNLENLRKEITCKEVTSGSVGTRYGGHILNLNGFIDTINERNRKNGGHIHDVIVDEHAMINIDEIQGMKPIINNCTLINIGDIFTPAKAAPFDINGNIDDFIVIDPIPEVTEKILELQRLWKDFKEHLNPKTCHLVIRTNKNI